jgi:tRNA threonylcarbamoyladenosine biosynthesis protein TsaE
MPILNKQSLEFISRSAEHTRRMGMRLGRLLQRGDLVCLVGELASGKTTLVQGVTNGWGSLDRATSPTFVLVNVYRHPNGDQLFHLDAYRLSGASEAMDLDLDAMLEKGPLLVEWADRIAGALPDEYLEINFSYVATGQRDLMFNAVGQRSQALLTTLRKQIYGVS